MPGKWVALVVFAAGAVPATVLAQESGSYRLEEHQMNAGGRPLQGQVAASASFRIALDALGQPFAGPGAAASAGFRVSIGAAAGLLPVGEVKDLRFTTPQTLTWTADPDVGDFVVYRGPAGGSPPALWGVCSQSGVTHPSTSDTTVPAVGTGFVYLVGARDRLRAPGPLGSTSAGVPRTPSSPCP